MRNLRKLLGEINYLDLYHSGLYNRCAGVIYPAKKAEIRILMEHNLDQFHTETIAEPQEKEVKRSGFVRFVIDVI
jgi:hypothetical protein